MTTLHIHVDESGDFDFSPKGSQYYLFTTAWTYNPAPMAAALNALRFQLIKDGHFRPNVLEDLAGFHACDDPRPRREAVIGVLRNHLDWNFASIVVQKNRVNPAIYDPGDFYPKFLAMVIKFILRGRVRPRTNQVLIYTETLPMRTRAMKAAVNQTLKASCQRELNGKPFKIMHHVSESNYWLQVVDYCSWSVCRKWESHDTWAYDLLHPRIAATEITPMSRGDGTIYY